MTTHDSPARDLLPVASRRETTALALKLLRSRRIALLLTIATFAGVGLAGIVPPWVIGQVVDAVRDGAPRSEIHRLAAIIAGAAALGGLLTSASAAALAHLVAPTLAELREDVLDSALHLEHDRVEAAGIGDVVSRVSDDVRSLTQSLEEAFPVFIGAVVAVVFTAGGLFALDWRLGLAGLGAAPFYAGALRWYLPRSAPYYRRERTAQGERADALVSGVGGAATLRAFGIENRALDRIMATSRAARRITVDVFVLFTRYGSRMNASELVGLIFVLTAGYLLVDLGGVTVGAATAAALYFHRLFNPIGAILFVFDDVQSSGAALARLAGVAGLRAPADTTTRALGDDLTLRIEGVSHSYESGHEVLHDADLVVRPGEHVAIVGATGAGKSTLGGIVAGAIVPSGGRVLIGEVPVSLLGHRALRDAVCLVSQEVHVFSATLRENLELARGHATDDELWAALRTVHADAWARALPHQLATVVGDLGHALTPAQAQQVALARIVLRDPAVTVLDEATAEAGSSGARDLERAAQAAIAGRSAIVIAHRLTQARIADRVVVMHEGRIVEEGTHDELVAAGGRYATLWRAWAD